jgi:23S rRNA (cytidine1920-2'-O)/16S rRNA (cytidine1409-2'-O)-methyltransferase
VLVDGIVEHKASRQVNGEHVVSLSADAPQYVSRGAEKLVAGLGHFGCSCADKRIMDIGASTGGFTEVLLQNGAREVFAIDVGRGQLVEALRVNPRVCNMEGVDARKLDGKDVRAPVDALVCDVSFISLTKALSVPLMLVTRGGWALVLVKPQFEAGPNQVGTDGVLRDAAVRERVVSDIARWFGSQSGWIVDGVIVSPIAGGSGNEEYLLGARRDG